MERKDSTQFNFLALVPQSKRVGTLIFYLDLYYSYNFVVSIILFYTFFLLFSLSLALTTRTEHEEINKREKPEVLTFAWLYRKRGIARKKS